MLDVVGTTYFSKSSSRPEAKSFCLKGKNWQNRKIKVQTRSKVILLEGKINWQNRKESTTCYANRNIGNSFAGR
jgi:osmotically-inducible protein OsmY